MGIFDIFGFGKKKKKIAECILDGSPIIDVRSVSEFSSGHVKGSINIPLDKITSSIEKLKKYKKPIIVCCASGMRSASAASVIGQHGIEVYNAGSWRSLN